jgi:hypothetical protein
MTSNQTRFSVALLSVLVCAAIAASVANASHSHQAAPQVAAVSTSDWTLPGDTSVPAASLVFAASGGGDAASEVVPTF